MKKQIRIGVFDSGIGGRSVANAIEQAFPDSLVTFVNDKEHVPYATKTPDELYKLALPILRKLSEQSDIIVIACNTVSTTISGKLRAAIAVPIVALDPMVKPAAAHTETGIIAVCATPTTLASDRYNELKKSYAEGLTVIEPDCANWSLLIENDQIDRQQVEGQVETMCAKGADVIVLACTHYHWIEEIIQQATKGRAAVLQPEQAIVARLKALLTTG